MYTSGLAAPSPTRDGQSINSNPRTQFSVNVVKGPNKPKDPFARNINSWPADDGVFTSVWAMATQTVGSDVSNLFRWIRDTDESQSAFAYCKGHYVSRNQQGHSVKTCPKQFCNWSILLNPDVLHRPDTEHIWST